MTCLDMDERLSCIRVQRCRVWKTEQGHTSMPCARGSGYTTAGDTDSSLCITMEIAGCMSE